MSLCRDDCSVDQGMDLDDSMTHNMPTCNAWGAAQAAHMTYTIRRTHDIPSIGICKNRNKH